MCFTCIYRFVDKKMKRNVIKFVVLFVVPVIDICVSSVLLVHGNKWHTFALSIAEYSFPTSFVDLWFFACLRTCVIFGGTFGVLKNWSAGPKRCTRSIRMIYFFACINAYYACIKLLSFSDGPEFVAGPKLNWFWSLFAWSLVGSLLCILLWHLLCSIKFVCNEVSLHSNTENVENQPLLSESRRKSFSTDTDSSNSLESNGIPDSCDVKYMPINSYGATDKKHETCINEQKGTNKKTKEKEKDKPLDKATLGAMLSYSFPDWPWIVCGVIFLTAASVAQVFIPLYIGKVVSGIVVSKDSSKFLKDILIMAGISLLASICSGLRGGCFMITIQKFNIRVRNALFSSILSQEIGFFDDMKTGDITSRLTSDTTTMSDTIGLNCNIFLRNVIKAIGVCVFMFALSWRMSILTLMGLPVVFAVSELYGKYYKKLQKMVQDRFAIANEVAEEVCSSMQTVRSFANEDGERKRYNEKTHEVYKIQFKQAVCYAGYVWSTQSIELMLTVSTLWFGGHLLLENHLTAQNFISFILYQEALGECFSEIGEVYTGLMQALGAAEKVFELIKRKPKISTDEGDVTTEYLKGRISFKNVTFSYPMRPNQTVLKDVSFEVEPGEVVALVGPSGSGKSSCVKLLQRFYDPTSGSVLLDGLPVSLYKHEFLHKKISMVGQEPVLFACSIRDNIKYGPDSACYSEDEVRDAAVKTNCHDFIMELSEKYDTETGEKGTQLSGGQKQRVAIARAMVRNPCVLLLDEATSALDTESEYLVQEALERSKSNRTVLLIAHRLSTVKRADRIVVIVKGKVEEIGNHKELMKNQGVYFNLVRKQLNDTDVLDGEAATHSNGGAVMINPPVTEDIFFSQRKSSCNLSSSLRSDSSFGSVNFNI